MPNVHRIVIVSGSTCIPRIVKLVSNFFNGKEPNKSINPNEAITMMLLSKLLSSLVMPQGLLPLDVSLLSLSIETAGGVMTVLV